MLANLAVTPKLKVSPSASSTIFVIVVGFIVCVSVIQT